MTFPALRPRLSAHDRVTGAMSRIIAGAFGTGAPVPQVVLYQGYNITARYHQGDTFLPGAEGFVYEPTQELPIKAWWGGGSGVNQGTPYRANAWPVFGAPPVVSYPTVTRVGLGGLQAGAFVQQPLLDQFSQ